MGTGTWDMGWVYGTSMLGYITKHDIQTFRLTLGDTDLGHGVALGDQHGGLH